MSTLLRRFSIVFPKTELFISLKKSFSNATRFAVSVNEDQERLPTFYWLPKLHKKTYKARFIANSSSCTTTELSKLLTSCLTTIKNHVIEYCEKSMKGPVKSFLVNQNFM